MTGKTYETSKERKLRELDEARQDREAYERELPMIVLREMARATELGVSTKVMIENERIQVMFIWEEGHRYSNSTSLWIGSENSSNSWDVYVVSSNLDDIHSKKIEEARQWQLRQVALSKLSPEERMALGL